MRNGDDVLILSLSLPLNWIMTYDVLMLSLYRRLGLMGAKWAEFPVKVQRLVKSTIVYNFNRMITQVRSLSRI